MDKININKFDITRYDKPYIPKIEKDIKKIKELFNKISNLNTHEILIFSSMNNLSLDVLDENDNTLIHEVILLDKDEHLKLNFIKFLVQNGVNPDYPNKINKTPFHEACRLQLNNIIEYLINLNVNTNFQDDNGYTPLHYLLLGNIQINKNIKQKDFIEIKNSNNINNNSDEMLNIKKNLFKIIKNLMDSKNLPLLETLKNTINDIIDEFDDSDIKFEINNFVLKSIYFTNEQYHANLYLLNEKLDLIKLKLSNVILSKLKNVNLNNEYLMIHKIENPKTSWCINTDSEFGLIKNYNSKIWIKEQIKDSINKIINLNNNYKIININTNSVPEILSNIYQNIFSKVEFKFSNNSNYSISIYDEDLLLWLYSGHILYNNNNIKNINNRNKDEYLSPLPAQHPPPQQDLPILFLTQDKFNIGFYNTYRDSNYILNDVRLKTYNEKIITKNVITFNDYYEPKLVENNIIKHYHALDNASDIINLNDSYFMSGPRKYKILFTADKFNKNSINYNENDIYTIFNNITKLNNISSIILYLLCVPIDLNILNNINFDYLLWYFLDINNTRYKNYFNDNNNNYPNLNENLLDINNNNIINYIYSSNNSKIIEILKNNTLIKLRKNIINKDNWFIDNDNICYNDYPYIKNDNFYKNYLNVDKTSVLQSERYKFNKNNNTELLLHHVLDLNLNNLDQNIFKILNYEITCKMIIYIIYSYYAIYEPEKMYNINKNKLFDIILDNEIHKNVHYQNYKFYYNNITDNFEDKWVFKNNIEKNNFASKWYNIYIKNVLNNRIIIGIWIYNMWCDLMCKFSTNNLDCYLPYRLLILTSILTNESLNTNNLDKYIINIFKIQLIKYINNMIKSPSEYNYIYLLYILLDNNLTINEFKNILNDINSHYNNFKNNIYSKNTDLKLINIINILIQYIINNNINDKVMEPFKEYFLNKKQTIKNILFNIIIDYYNSLVIKPNKQFFTDFIFIFYNNLNNIELLDYNYTYTNNISVNNNIPSYLFSYYNINLDNNKDYTNKFIISQILGLYNLGLVDTININSNDLDNIYYKNKNYKLFNHDSIRDTSYTKLNHIYEPFINNIYTTLKPQYNQRNINPPAPPAPPAPPPVIPGGAAAFRVPRIINTVQPPPLAGVRPFYNAVNTYQSHDVDINQNINPPSIINEKENNYILLLPNKYYDNLGLQVPNIERVFEYEGKILDYHLYDNKKKKLVKSNFPLPLNYTFNIKMIYYPYYAFEPPTQNGVFRDIIQPNLKFKNFYYNINNDHYLTNILVVPRNLRAPQNPLNINEIYNTPPQEIDKTILTRLTPDEMKVIEYVNDLPLKNNLGHRALAAQGIQPRIKPEVYFQPGLKNVNLNHNAGNISNGNTYNGINLNRTNIYQNDDNDNEKYYLEKDRPKSNKTFNTRQNGYYDIYNKYNIKYVLQDRDTRFFEGLNYFNYNNQNNEFYDFYYNIETNKETGTAEYIAPLNTLYINKLINLIHHYQNKIKEKYTQYINIFNSILSGYIKEYHKLFTEYYTEIIKINNILDYIINLYNLSQSENKESIIKFDINTITNELNYINSLYYLYYYIYYPNKKYKLLKFNYELLNNNLLQYHNFFNENTDYDKFYDIGESNNNIKILNPPLLDKQQIKINNYFNNEIIITNKYNIINMSYDVDKSNKLPPAIYNILDQFYIRVLIQLIIEILNYINNSDDKIVTTLNDEIINLIKNKLIKSNTLLIKNYYIALIIQDIIKDCVEIFINNAIAYKYNKVIDDKIMDKINIKILDLNINLNTINSNDILLNINNNNIINIYDLTVNKSTKTEFILYSNDFSNNKLVNLNYTININNKIIELLVLNNCNPLILNNNNIYCINNILKIYYYEPLIKFKELGIYFNDENNINYLKLENLNNCNKILYNISNNSNLYEILNNISNNLYIDIENKILFDAKFKNNILINIKESFYLCSYLIFHYLSFKLLKTTPLFTIDNLNELLKLININHINLFNIYLFDNINEYYNIEYIIASSLLNNLNIELNQVNQKISTLENYNNKIYLDNLKYDNTSELKKLKFNLENKINNLNKITKTKLSVNFIKNKINDDVNIIKNYNIINNHIILMNNWNLLFNKPLNNNYNLVIILLLSKQKEIFENLNISNDFENLNTIKNGFKHLSDICENYFNNNNNELSTNIYNILLYITKLTIGVNIEYILRKSLYIYFVNSEEDTNIENIYIKINYILTEKLNNIDISLQEMLYGQVCESLVKNAIKNFNDLNEELSVDEILKSFLNLLKNVPIIIDNQILLEINLQILNYFSTITFDLILYWYINIENILRFIINNYRCLETFNLLIN